MRFSLLSIFVHKINCYVGVANIHGSENINLGGDYLEHDPQKVRGDYRYCTAQGSNQEKEDDLILTPMIHHNGICSCYPCRVDKKCIIMVLKEFVKSMNKNSGCKTCLLLTKKQEMAFYSVLYIIINNALL